jgi:catechol 2,3-dioxygenase-like lactoylglutathione lyase family enzyme
MPSVKAVAGPAAAIHHIALRTTDVARLTAFYRDVLGLPAAVPGAGAGDRAWLSAGPTLVMIEPRGQGEPSIPSGSMELIAFTIAPNERAAARARLASAGVAVEDESRFTIYVRDPDGRRLGLSHYPTPEPGP